MTSSSELKGRQRPGSQLAAWHMGHAGGSRRMLMPYPQFEQTRLMEAAAAFEP